MTTPGTSVPGAGPRGIGTARASRSSTYRVGPVGKDELTGFPAFRVWERSCWCGPHETRGSEGARVESA